MKTQPIEYYPNQPLESEADVAEQKPKTVTQFTSGRAPGSPDNLNRHNAATGEHQVITAESREAMVGTIRAALHGVSMPDETMARIKAARTECAEAEEAAMTAKAELDALEADHRAALEKLETIAGKPEPDEVDKVIAEKLALEKQKARIEIITGRLSDARSKSQDLRIAANAALSAVTKLETAAARAFALGAMPAPRGPLVSLEAAAAAWALDAALHPEKQNFPVSTLGEFLDNHFTKTEALALIEAARAEISTAIRG